MKKFIVEFASNVNNYLDGGLVTFAETKEEADVKATEQAAAKFRELEDEIDDELEFVNNGIYMTDEFTDEMKCLYIVTVREVEIPA